MKKKKTETIFTEQENEIIYNAMNQILEWQSESFSKEEMKIVKSIIKKLKKCY